MEPIGSQRVMTEPELAEKWRISPKTLQNRRSSRAAYPGHNTPVPAYFKPGGQVLYFVAGEDGVEQWERDDAAYQRQKSRRRRWNDGEANGDA